MAGRAPRPEGSVADARARQQALARGVEPRDRMAGSLRTIAGFAVGFEDGGATVRAAAVLLDAVSLDVMHDAIARLPATTPYVPGLLSFRELPALLGALEALPEPPDLAFVHGHGIAYPGGLGIAAHFGVATGLPTIGVAGKVLLGSGPEPHQTRGAYTALRDPDRRQIGWLLRSRPGCPPLVVSPGHRVAMASAADLVMRCVTRHRLPEPTRLAGALVSGGAGQATVDNRLQVPEE